VQIHNGFPTDSVVGPDGKGKGFLMRFDPKSLLMPDNYYDATFLGHTKLSSSPPTYRFVFDVAQPAGKAGDYVAVSQELCIGPYRLIKVTVEAYRTHRGVRN